MKIDQVKPLYEVHQANFKSKKELKAAIEAGQDVSIHDPSITGERTYKVSSLKPGESHEVTNPDKRSWFAKVGKDKDGKVYVK